MAAKRKKTSRTKINFLIDILIFAAFLVAMDPRLTGIAIHEWLSIAFGAAIVVHLLLHWNWLVATTKRILGKMAAQARLNYVLNTLFFIDMTLILFTGIMISEAALPWLGIQLPANFFWRRLHSLTADLGVFILGLHVALHWKWLGHAFKRYVLRPLPTLSLRQQQEAEA